MACRGNDMMRAPANLTRTTYAATLSTLFLAALVAATTTRAAQADSKTGEAKFTGVKRETVRVALGDKLKLTAEFQMIEVGRSPQWTSPRRSRTPPASGCTTRTTSPSWTRTRT